MFPLMGLTLLGACSLIYETGPNGLEADFGRITGEVEIAEGVKVRVVRTAISEVRVKGEPVKADAA